MAKLKAAQRNRLPSSAFAGPDRSYPVNDRSHARNALSRVSQHGTAALKARVRAAVHRKFPGIGQQEHASGGRAQAHVDGKPVRHRLDRKR
jgi:hypothetical protein